ncbi:type VI secretion system contractile sheath large subunit [Photobacterium minamisatsumaniensis]|uniref:type VI secretion system contractile sheath large subunit n=1 Tax=Photobacterium minamisatsumaniensis TaxID=2910233 RepID=UPI003D1382E3
MISADLQEQLIRLDSNDKAYLKNALLLLAQLDQEMLKSKQALRASINHLIAEIDRLVSEQLSALIHHSDFSQLESTWRGVETLVSLPVNYQKIKVKILDLSWDQLSHELNTAVSLKRTALYNLIGNRELNTSGGQPYGMVVVDHKISMNFESDYDDLYTLELLAQMGDMCLCPFISSPADNFFGESGADWLSDTARIDKIIQGPEFISWQRLRSLSISRFIGITLPNVCLRQPYTSSSAKRVVFNNGNHTGEGLWGNSAFLFASIAMREFNRINWFGFMKSRWQDKHCGALVNLPPTGPGTEATLHPAPDIRFITEMGGFYADYGFIPLCHSLTTDKYFFRGNASIWNHGKDDAEAVMGQIQTTLMICRIAHYLKVQIRGMMGNFQTAKECENFLNSWLDRYASNLSDADESTLAKYPLSKGRVEVKEIEGQLGRFTCDVLVQPQYQFDNACGEVLISTDLGAESSGYGIVGGAR